VNKHDFAESVNTTSLAIISVKNRSILMKFGTLHQILNPVTVTGPKIENFKIQHGGGRHLENRLFWP